jgi:hypothetical protein
MSTASGDAVARFLIRVSANEQPHLKRHCLRCATERRFVSSGKFRVNAQKKSLDAWLIFLCTACDYRWNLPIHERQSVNTIDPTELDALMRNDAAWAARYAAAGSISSDVAVTLAGPVPLEPKTTTIEMAIAVTPACAIRLDRLLARVLGLQREETRRLSSTSLLTITPASQKALRRPAIDGQTIRIDLTGCSEELRTRLAAALLSIPAPDRPG